MTTAPALADATARLAQGGAASGKPMLFVMQPGKAAAAARARLLEAGVPFTNSLGEAVERSRPVPLVRGGRNRWRSRA